MNSYHLSKTFENKGENHSPDGCEGMKGLGAHAPIHNRDRNLLTYRWVRPEEVNQECRGTHA